MSKMLSGGRSFPMPGGTVTSVNLTPNETGLGNWTSDQFITRFKDFENPQNVGIVPSGGFNTIMTWTLYAGMTEQDLRSIFHYLPSLEPLKNRVMRFTPGS